MKAKVRYISIAFIGVLLLAGNMETRGQVFWLGVNGGATYSWFTSPKADNLVTGDGLGWNLGFFARYGKRPFYQLGFHWTRAATDMKYFLTDDLVIEDQVPFHNFDLVVKAGYEIIRKSMFKWHVNGGPLIGTSLLFSTNIFDIERDDMRNPQLGLAAGTGIQFMNFILDLDYQYHLTELFVGDETDLGIDFGSHLQHITLKVGLIF
jgi:hypothetical protein